MKYYMLKKAITEKLYITLIKGYSKGNRHIKNTQDCKLNEFYQSIIYRLESVIFHEKLLHDQIDFGKQFIDKTTKRGTKKTKQVYDQVYYIFDDLVFNLSSLFDYTANVLGFFYIGQNKQNIKWNGLLKYLRDSSNHFGNDCLRDFLIDKNRIFIDGLYGYRSELIHNAKDKSFMINSYDFTTEEQTIVISPPERFLNRIKLKSCDNADIYDVSKYLVQECLFVINRITDFIYTDDNINLIRRKELDEAQSIINNSIGTNI